MVSSRAKGQQYVKEAITIYEEAGFVCWKPGNKAVFLPGGRAISASQDIFQAFDFVATSEQEIHWVQCKSYQESHASEARHLINGLPMPIGTVRVVLCRQKRKKYTFKVWVRKQNEWSRPFIIKRGDICGIGIV